MAWMGIAWIGMERDGDAGWRWSAMDAVRDGLVDANCTIVGNSAPEGSAFSCVGLSYLAMSRTIIAFQTGGSAAQCREGSCDSKFSFCDIFGNAGGDWVGCLAPLAGVEGNVSIDPRFRSADGEDFRLLPTSPLGPAGSGPPSPAAPPGQTVAAPSIVAATAPPLGDIAATHLRPRRHAWQAHSQ
jgi:hypothetical protein